jgi:Na+-driven multidrug efflux pump
MLRLLTIGTIAISTKLVFSGALRAAGDTTWVMWVSIAIHWAMAVAVVLLVRIWPVHPLIAWSTLILMNNSHAGSVFYRYKTDKWKQIRLIG